jgi:hypothetical protein
MGSISLAGSRIEAMIETLDSGSQRTYQVPSDSLTFFRVWPGVTAQAGQRGVNGSSSMAERIAFRGSRRSIFFLWSVGMTNVGGLIAPEGILSDVRSMIPNPL